MTRTEFFEHTLPNGLKVIAEVNPGAKSVAVGYFVRTGSRDEIAGEEGVSHFLEHMVFKGTKKRSAWDVNREFDEMGAKYNAFTSEEMTVYYGAVLPEFLPRLLDLLSDMMRPALREEDFDSEKQVILEEIALYQDRPDAVLFEKAQRRYFGSHPLAKPVLGTTKSVSAMRVEQLRDYHHRRYVPGNMILAFSGNLMWDEALMLAEGMTAEWSQGEAPRNYPPFKPKPGFERQSFEKATQLYATFVAPGYSARREERYVAKVLAEILGDADNGRLFWRLVDSGLAESALVFHQEYDDLGTFYIYLQGNPANEKAMSEAVIEELRKLQAKGVSDGELARAKLKAATSLVFAGETTISRLFYVGMNYSYTKRYEPLDAVRRWLLHLETYHVEELLEEKPFDEMLEYHLVPVVEG